MLEKKVTEFEILLRYRRFFYKSYTVRHNITPDLKSTHSLFNQIRNQF